MRNPSPSACGGAGGHLIEVLIGNLSTERLSYAGGAFSKTSSPSAKVIQGCLLRVQICRVGRSQEVSSSVPARTRTTPSRAGPEIHDPQSGQTHRVLILPLSARRCRGRAS